MPNLGMQAPLYTRNANFAQDERSNVGGRSTVRTDQVDGELDEVAASLNAVNKNLQLIQRDDGKLRDASVDLYALTAVARTALMVKINQRGLWATAQVYAVGDLVDVGGIAYLCAIAHTSTVFATDYAAGLWQIFITTTSAAGLPFTPTSTISAGDVQAAIDEIDTKLRAMVTPLLAFNYGGL